MLKTIILYAVFAGHGASTTTTTTIMPDMKTCESVERGLYAISDKAECGFLSCTGVTVQAPVKTKCEEL